MKYLVAKRNIKTNNISLANNCEWIVSNIEYLIFCSVDEWFDYYTIENNKLEKRIRVQRYGTQSFGDGYEYTYKMAQNDFSRKSVDKLDPELLTKFRKKRISNLNLDI